MAIAHPAIFELLGHFMQGDLAGFTCYTAKNNKVVWFVKSPPLEPASELQLQLRNAFRINGSVWRSFPPADRATWNDAATFARLRIHGYNLFTYWMRTKDHAAIATIERISGITIIKPAVGT